MNPAMTRLQGPGYALSVSRGEGNPPQEAYVEVRFANGRALAARLHTPESVRAILDDWRRKGEQLGVRSGLYFWAPGVIVVREITPEGITALVEDLVAEGELDLAFVPLDDV